MHAPPSSVAPLGAGALILAGGSLGPMPFEERVAAAAAGGFDGIGLSVWEYARLRDQGYEVARMRDILNGPRLRLAGLEVFLGFSVAAEAARTEPIPGVRYTDRQTETMFFDIA